MLIKEYRIPLPLTVEEYRIAQLYMIAVSILLSYSVIVPIKLLSIDGCRRKAEKRAVAKAVGLRF